MIPFEITYHRPRSIEEAVHLFDTLQQQGKKPLYYGGGTEIITLSRLHLVAADAVIDIKHIPECRTLEFNPHELVLGSALPLTTLEEANPFPLLTKAAREVADRTARNQITLGGNICGQIFYRETVLPLLLSDSQAVIAGKDGVKQCSIHDVFLQHIRLKPGQFLVQMKVDRSCASLPHFHRKRRKQGKVGYPLVTAAAIKKDGQIRVALSGVCPFPFRSKEMEERLNARHLPLHDRIEGAIRALPRPILDDIEGSAAYRLFVLKQMLFDMIDELGGE
ncbi:FAD binding domain-containing protein [Parageobacillus sp. VR-IP]|uniref:Xanthine dehydrogenase, FAD binding subunit n=1 Tax=Saccharococcus caldoxylosilyticus TaxID=81408 RepID=A0A150KTU6_9BACL|nr:MULTISPECIES: FAD binding domain-containing protein [Parageobacillus]KYD03557.1 Xanthine dehydrogenase, FAD binding subunit [Parageobacillus caldoxylosilyticus]NUK31643.1 FAD binding domain-containing protein [Parageobacillus sp. VR-IP]